ncbi:IucA/IucC family protein [Staphylococcus sp. 17KM0847]|uniref:IucA/IucC family protein n=1 Tax=Staphylococcus sp. 17KM0847 TaxID=2583989 RepID=UPI0015DD4D34|nr:IucA/IucC family protein [Staphylococcus sp. 17KM0847]QLK86568.1 siderophore synthetase [Staphylococcus sp. 17KM0847]
MTVTYHHKEADLMIQYRVLIACIKESLFPKNTQIDIAEQIIKIRYHQHVLYAHYATQSAFYQFTMEGEIVYKVGDTSQNIQSLEQLIDILSQHFNIKFHEQLIAELQHSVLGLELSYRQYTHRQVAMEHASKFSRMPSELNFIAWLTHMGEDEDFSVLGYTEGMVWHGHPSHPLTKTKRPLTSSEIQAYAPEFMRVVPLKIVLVDQAIVCETSMETISNFMINTVIPDMARPLRQFLEPYEKELSNYRVLFVHPWQYENVIVQAFDEAIRLHKVIPTPFTVDAKATLSFRTMYLLKRPYHIKLPLNVQATSAVRTVSTVTTVDGPHLSYQLQELLNEYPTLQVAMEPYGVYVDAPADTARQFAMIVRQTPETTSSDITQLVTACLIERNPVDKQVVVDSLIEYLYGVVSDDTIRQFIREYSRALIIPLVGYIQKYGIALEAHQQNTILQINREDQKFSFIVRDLGGSRIDVQTLQKAVPNIQLTNHSLIAEDIEAVIAKFQHAVIQNQLGTLIHHFKHVHKSNDAVLYRIVGDVVCQAIQPYDAHADVLERVLFDERVNVKALLSMRIAQQVKKYVNISLDNPLYTKR